MLKQRVITALVLSAIILAVLFLLPGLVFTSLVLAIAWGAAWEWANLASLEKAWQQIAYATLAMLLVSAGIFLPEQLRDIEGVAVAWWAIALLWVLGYPGSATLWGSTLARVLMGFLVIVPSTLALVLLLEMQSGKWLFIYVVGIVIAADVGAYFAGRAWGKKKLAPAVSPGKSWAGFWGGLAFAMLVSVIVGLATPIPGLSLPQLIGITLFTALASVLGDLLESMVKRHRGIKDSSQILPGHGGVMDRIDSLTAAVPVFTLLLLLLRGT